MNTHPEVRGEPIISHAVQSILIDQMRDELKYGVQDYPNGTSEKLEAQVKVFSDLAVAAARTNSLGWSHLILVQAYDALSQTEPGHLRESLTHLGRTVVQWIEHLDRTHGGV